MSDHAAFFKAIIAAPDDDLPRLVYADYMDENGKSERAEFIRLQCEIARREQPVKRDGTLVAFDHGEDYDALRRRERELFRASGPLGWWYELPGQWRSTGDDMMIKTVSGCEYHVRRGFVHSVRCRLIDWYGRWCNTCGGHWTDEGGVRPLMVYECDNCGGKGWKPGIGPRVVAEQPVALVRVTDREPNDYGPPEDGCRFGWLVEGAPGHEGPSCLPRHLAEVMAKERGHPVRWATREAAHAALSAHLIEWAKTQPLA